MKKNVMIRGYRVVLLAALATFISHPLSGQAPPALTPGQAIESRTGFDDVALFAFQAETAGVLTVVVRSLDESDLVLLVTDADGQSLPNGRSDQDLGGDSGAEQFSVTLPRAGGYRIQVETFGGGQAAFMIGASWLSFPQLEIPEDTDGSPAGAMRIAEGQDAHEDSIDGVAGDYRDWYVLTAEVGGTLTVAIRGEEGDLVLEAFGEGEFTDPIERSDQDLQENGANEAITLVVEAGQTFYFRVAGFSDGAAVAYRLQVGLIPD